MAFVGSPFVKYDTVNGRVEGDGKYVFADGTTFTGSFKDGRFHGPGIMTFPNGVQYQGKWEHGEAVEGVMRFADGLEFDADLSKWDYCTPRDRRFYQERVGGIRPADDTQITPNDKQGSIPVGTYDVADGYYDPADQWVHKYSGEKLRFPEPEEREWIVKTCYYRLDETD
ncbi:MORN repeat-containing protein 5-like protein [Catenaria anguillulae PL171]|uniref:MORN repeat-containing protein 5 n=1 Tax=Catenaria anguillulae PL171 TaxID=765915 RepID=A0A1Y2I021_9FUNG|nr:MORN repeat-containing protein 5-like protein [Catenaria anguillulae PL171]